jgi:hypothetical protein
MKNAGRSLLGGIVLSNSLLLVWFLVVSVVSQAQVQNNGNNGLNAVWQGSNNVASPAFVDASAYTSQGDICATLNYILEYAASPGVVIDARGVLPGTIQPCGTNPFLYRDGSKSTFPATILLPPGTITICTTWIMPVLTKLIGEGPGQSGTIGTTLQVGSSLQCGGNSFSGTAMIQMGGTSNCNSMNCFSVSVSDLALDGQSSNQRHNGNVRRNERFASWIARH